MKLIILVEGYTELGLKAFFAQEAWQIEIIPCKGADKLLNDFPRRAGLELEGQDETYALCLLDYDKAAERYPHPHDDISEHVQHIRQVMEAQVEDSLSPRVKCFPIIHEPETWILADEQGLRQYLGLGEREYKRPSAPESLSDPKERLKQEFKKKGRAYSERTDGPKLLEQAGKLGRVLDDNCPLFKKMWAEIRAWQAGPSSDPLPPQIERLATLENQLSEKRAALQKLLQKSNLKYKLLTHEELEDIIREETAISNEIAILEAQIAELRP